MNPRHAELAFLIATLFNTSNTRLANLVLLLFPSLTVSPPPKICSFICSHFLPWYIHNVAYAFENSTLPAQTTFLTTQTTFSIIDVLPIS